MAKLKGIRVNLNPMYAKFSRRIEAILRSQAPRRTGALAESIRVIVNREGLQIVLQPLQGKKSYGEYLHRGTGEERAAGSSTDFETTYVQLMDRAWNPRPGRGVGGIKPRYFLNLNDTVYEMMNDELAQEFAKQQGEFLTQILQDAIKI